MNTGSKLIRKLKIEKTDYYFILAGILAVSTDYFVYILIKNYVTISFAKGVSFFCGIIVSWIINSNLTFKNRKQKIIKFLKYLLVLFFTMSLNIAVNNFFLYLLHYKYKVILSFFVATLCSTISNFIFFKYWVFKK